MKPNSPHSMQVVKREEKENALFQFVLSEIAAGRVTLVGQWNVVALTMDSPAIAALSRVIADLGDGSNLRLRILLTGRGAHKLSPGFNAIGELLVRVSQCSQLLDAHEQLVLGETSFWTGDCMRRNPRERDAFERFSCADTQQAEWALRAFNRLWSVGVPLSGSFSRAAGGSSPIDIDGVLATEGAKANAVISATSRH